jgi:hypothetical protein
MAANYNNFLALVGIAHMSKLPPPMWQQWFQCIKRLMRGITFRVRFTGGFVDKGIFCSAPLHSKSLSLFQS